MDKFYRAMLLVLFTFLGMLNASAQWNENLSENLLISKSGFGALDLVQVGKTSDDKIFISWLSWENENGYIKLQLLDKDGKALLQEGGMYVSKQPTPTWSSGYGFAVTEDGCAVIVNCDTRNSQWQPYVYKISQTGEQLWGEAGKPLLQENEGTGLNPHVCITKSNNVLVGFQNMVGGRTDVQIMKLQENGSKAWGGSISLSGANGIFNMTPSGADGIIATYYEASTNNYLAMKYTANGEEAWAEKTLIDDSGLVKTTAEPSVISDGADGIITSWRYAVSQFGVAGKVQRVDSQGNKRYEEEGVLLEDLSAICFDPSVKALYTACANRPKDAKNMVLNRYNENGDLEWNVEEISGVVASQFAIYGMVPVADGILVIYRNASTYNQATVEYSKIDFTGEVVQSNVTISDAAGDKGRGGLALLSGQFVIAWSDNALSVFAQNVEIGKGSSITDTHADGKDQFSIRYNPGQKSFTMSLAVDTPANASVSIFDLTGKRVADLGTTVLDGGMNEHTYTVPTLSSGIYLLMLQTSEGTFCGKLIID